MSGDIKSELELMFMDLDGEPSTGDGDSNGGDSGASDEGGSNGGSPTSGQDTPTEGGTPPEGETPPKDEPWKAQMDLLTAGQNELKGMFAQVMEKLSSPGETPPKEGEVKPEETSAFDLVNQEEFDKVLSGDVSTLNELLNRAVKKGFEQAMLAVPEAVQRRVESSIDGKTQVKMYFGDNPDLVPHSKFVGVIAQELVEKNPELSRDAGRLLKEAGNELRKRFNLPKPSPVTQTPPAGNTPPSDTGGRQGSPAPKQKVQAQGQLSIAEQIAQQFAD